MPEAFIHVIGWKLREFTGHGEVVVKGTLQSRAGVLNALRPQGRAVVQGQREK